MLDTQSFQEKVFADEAILTSDLDESDVIEFTTSIKKAKLHYIGDLFVSFYLNRCTSVPVPHFMTK